MKKYTLEEYREFPRDKYGYKVCPAGDYSDIKYFEYKSRFDYGCKFGDNCYFSICCKFGNLCRFGENCRFDDDCEFGNNCIFGSGCKFGSYCTFAELCAFGIKTTFEDNKVINGRYIAIDRIGSEDRKTYFFIDENENMFVRAGCWFGSIDEFQNRIEEVYGEGNKYYKQYSKAIELAKVLLDVEEE